MRVTRDVVVDLWPVYESGTASADTKALVEEFLGGDPEFARRIRAGEETMNEVLAAVPVMPPPDAERASLARTQLLLRLRFLCLVAASALTLLASILRPYRTVSAAIAIVSAAAWLGLAVITRGRQLTSAEVRAIALPFDRWRLACAALCVSSALFALVVHTFRDYSVPLALGFGLAWIGLELLARMRRPGA